MLYRRVLVDLVQSGRVLPSDTKIFIPVQEAKRRLYRPPRE
jgi:hypothetical protein